MSLHVKINKQDFLNLKTLLQEGRITEGKFKNKEIVTALKHNRSVIGGKRGVKVRYIELFKPENIFQFLRYNNYHIDSIEDIDSYIEEMFENKSSRDVIQKHTANTKSKKSPSLKGLYLSAPQPLTIYLDGSAMQIEPREGMGYFFFFTQEVTLSEDTIIVGVENYQVIWFAQRYAPFFKNKKVVFVMVNAYMLAWIEHQKHEYIHFGDFDLAGVSIYLNKVMPKLHQAQKTSFFIPQNIEIMLQKYGNTTLYQKQKHYKNLSTTDTQLMELLALIHKHKKGLEQEGIWQF